MISVIPYKMYLATDYPEASILTISCLFQIAGRSLFCLGLLIRHGNSLISTSGSRSFNLSGCLNLFKRHLRMEDFALKVRSLQVQYRQC